MLLPFAQANTHSGADELWLEVYYDDEPQNTASFLIENMMTGLTIEVEDADLASAIDISDLEPEEGDLVKLKAIIDPTDPTKIRTICFLYLAGYFVKTVQMYSNMVNLGDLDVSNTGQNIDWNTQILTENMKEATPLGTPTVITASRAQDLIFIVNWDHVDEYLPTCDNGFRFDVKFKFFLVNTADSSRTSKVTHTESDEKNGDFCTSPNPPEPTRIDPELTIRISPPSATTITEPFRASGSIMLSVHRLVAEYDDNNQGIGWNEVDSRLEQVFGPTCQVGLSCYHLVQVTWI